MAILSEGGASQLTLQDLGPKSAVWSETGASVDLGWVAYLPLSREELWSPIALPPQPAEACARTRPLPEALATYESDAEGAWTPIDAPESLANFHLPPIPLEACAASGCVAALAGTYYCTSRCPAALAPELPAAAACPAGWSEAGDYGCTPPADTSCAVEPCWLAAPTATVACSSRRAPLGARVHVGPDAPAEVVGAVWLPRGTYRGDVHLAPGAALYGECPEATTLRGAVRIDGGAELAALTVVPPDGVNGVVVGGTVAVTLRSLRVVDGGSGIAVRPGAVVRMDSVRVDGGRVSISATEATVEGHHLWLVEAIDFGLLSRGARVNVEDLAATGPGTIGVEHSPAVGGATAAARLRRLHLSGWAQVGCTINDATEVQDLRIDGAGQLVIGAVVQHANARARIERASIGGTVDRGFWVRSEGAVIGADLTIHGAVLGATFTASVTLARVAVLGSRRYGIDATDEVSLDLSDLTVRQGAEAVRLLPSPVSTGVRVRRALIEEAEVGLTRDGPQVTLEEVTVRRVGRAVRSNPCWIDPTLSAISVEDAAGLAQLDEP